MRKKPPYMAVGCNELNECKPIRATVICPNCGKRHKVKYGDRGLDDGTKVQSKTLAFVNCGKSSYLVGIDGQELPLKKGD
jgi:hypothetical protein